MTEVVVYIGTLSLTDEQRSRLLSLLPTAVSERLAKRQMHALDASLLAYTALRRLTDAYAPHLMDTLCFTPQGKPIFSRENTYFCSLSHTADALAVGLSDRPIGVDIQAITPVRETIVSRVFTANERATIAFAAPNEQNRIFTRFWAKKEAALKKSGEGLSGLRTLSQDSGIYTIKEYAQSVLAVCAEETAQVTQQPTFALLR